MYCKYCGTELADGTSVCTACKKPIGENVSGAKVVDTPMADALATSSLTFSIIGIVLIWLIPVLGIVFSALGIKKSKEYLALSPIPSTKANVANILSYVGLVLNIVSTVLTVISLVFAIFYIVFVIGISSMALFL